MTGDRNEMNVVSTGNVQCTEVLCLTGGSFRILRVRFGSTTLVGTQDSWKFSNTRPKTTVLEGIQAWEGRASIATILRLLWLRGRAPSLLVPNKHA